MKRLIVMFAVIIVGFLYMVSFVEAWDRSFPNTQPYRYWDRSLYDTQPYNTRPYRDSWGNRYKHYQNLWKDSDGDGVINYFDYNDRNPYIQNPYQRYFSPKRRY